MSFMQGLSLEAVRARLMPSVRLPMNSAALEVCMQNLLKILLVALSIFSLPLCTTVQGSSYQKRATRSQQVKANAPKSIDEQAQTLGERYWRGFLTSCGDSYYWKMFYYDQPTFYQGKGEPVIQVKGTFYPPRQLTEAERLNDVDPQPTEYEGTVSLWFRVGRIVSSREGGRDLSWRNNFTQTRTIRKIKGQWKVYELDASYYRTTSASCAETPDSIAKNKPQGDPVFERNGQIIFPANHAGWHSLGSGPFTVAAYGPICLDRLCKEQAFIGGLYGSSGDLRRPGGRGALAPNLRLGAIVAKIGDNGQPFLLFDNGKDHYDFNSNEELFIGINDINYPDNRGYFSLCIFQLGRYQGGRCTS